jgi:hypothetical protein
MKFDWDDKRSLRLINLHEQGLSFTEIAATIGCSRNSAIGKAHRLNLSGRNVVTIKKVTVVAGEKRGRLVNMEYNCLIWDLTDATCRFPLWGDEIINGDRFYCGNPDAEVSAGRPYCRKHANICHDRKYKK